jgi:uncharacterized protein YegJ (DUF2314 family)
MAKKVNVYLVGAAVAASLAIAVIAASPDPSATARAAPDSGYITVPNHDPDMDEAKAKARNTLAHFWEKFADPGADEHGFALKVAIPFGENNSEHIWTKDMVRKDGKISVVIDNTPRDVKTVRAGQRIEVADNQISDWMYVRNGKIVGNYTMRPLLKRMPAQDAARYRAMLLDP